MKLYSLLPECILEHFNSSNQVRMGCLETFPFTEQNGNFWLQRELTWLINLIVLFVSLNHQLGSIFAQNHYSVLLYAANDGYYLTNWIMSRLLAFNQQQQKEKLLEGLNFSIFILYFSFICCDYDLVHEHGNFCFTVTPQNHAGTHSREMSGWIFEEESCRHQQKNA